MKRKRRSTRLAANSATKQGASSTSSPVEDTPPPAPMEEVDLPPAPSVKLEPGEIVPESTLPDTESTPTDVESGAPDTEPTPSGAQSTPADTESTPPDAESTPAPSTESSPPLGEDSVNALSPVDSSSCESKSLESDSNLSPASESKSDPKLPDSKVKSSSSSPKPTDSDPKSPNSDPKPTDSDPKLTNSDPKPTNSDLKPTNSDPKPDSSTKAPKLSLKPLSSLLDTSLSSKEKPKIDKVKIEPGTSSSSAIEFETVFVDVQDYVPPTEQFCLPHEESSTESFSPPSHFTSENASEDAEEDADEEEEAEDEDDMETEEEPTYPEPEDPETEEEKYHLSCTGCEVTISSYDRLISHFEDHTWLKCFCDMCSLRPFFSTIGDLISHVTQNHSEYDARKFIIFYLLKKFILIDHRTNFKCLLCRLPFYGARPLIEHVREEHKNYCHMCGVFFNHKSLFQQHIQEHKTRKVACFYCKPCNIGFTTLSTALLHKESHTNSISPNTPMICKSTVPYLPTNAAENPCPYCPTHLPIHSSLHINQHIKNTCEVCHKSFISVKLFQKCTRCPLCDNQRKVNTPYVKLYFLSKPKQDVRRSLRNAQPPPPPPSRVSGEAVEPRVQVGTTMKRPPEPEPVVQAQPAKRVRMLPDPDHIPCLFCKVKERSALDLRAHMTTHHHYCKICLENYDTRNLLAIHWKSHLQTACGVCLEKYPTRQGVVHHHYTHHPGRSVSVVSIDPNLPEFDHKAAALDLQCVYCLAKPEVHMNIHYRIEHKVITCEKCKLKFRSKNNARVCAECASEASLATPPVSSRKSAFEAVFIVEENKNTKNQPVHIAPKPAEEEKEEESCTEENFDMPRIVSIHSIRDQITEQYTPTPQENPPSRGAEKSGAVKSTQAAKPTQMITIIPQSFNSTIVPRTQLITILPRPVQKNAMKLPPVQSESKKSSPQNSASQSGESSSSGTPSIVVVDPIEPVRQSDIKVVYTSKPKPPETSNVVQCTKEAEAAAGCSQNGKKEQEASKKGSDKFIIFCKLCYMFLPHYPLMKSHLDKSHSACFKICSCKKIFNNFDSFEQHVSTDHKSENSKKFVLNQIMEMGMVFRCAEFTAIRCALCGYSFQTMAWLKMHVSRQHSLYCRTCSLSFDTIVQFGAHKRDHERKKVSRLECQICLARFMSLKEMETHSLTNHDGLVRYKKVAVMLVEAKTSEDCPFCPERFEEREKLDEHVKEHPVVIPL